MSKDPWRQHEHTQNNQLLDGQLWFLHSRLDGGRRSPLAATGSAKKRAKKKKEKNEEKREGKKQPKRSRGWIIRQIGKSAMTLAPLSLPSGSKPL